MPQLPHAPHACSHVCPPTGSPTVPHDDLPISQGRGRVSTLLPTLRRSVLLLLTIVATLCTAEESEAQGIDMDRQLRERAEAQKEYKDTDADRHSTLGAIFMMSRTGDRRPAPIDTMMLNSFRRGYATGLSLAEAYTGTHASAYQSKVYFDRPVDLWGLNYRSMPYQHLMRFGDQARFFDTRIPYSYLSYLSGGSADAREQNFSGLVTTNLGPSINLGVEVDIDHAGGVYNSTASHNNTYRVFGSYTKERYEILAHVWNTNVVNQENGGITDMAFVERPDDYIDGRRQVQPKDIPTRYTSVWNRVNHGSARLNHRYRLGYYRYTDADGHPVAAPKKSKKAKRSEGSTENDSTTVMTPDSVGGTDSTAYGGRSTDELPLPDITADSLATAAPIVLQSDSAIAQSAAPIPADSVATAPQPKLRTGKSVGQEAPPDYDEEEGEQEELRRYFVPVTSIFHDIEYHRSEASFVSQNSALLERYPERFVPQQPGARYYPNDYMATRQLSNTLGIEMIEGFHKWAKVGIAAFVSLDYIHYLQPLMTQEDADRQGIAREVIEAREHTTYVGGRISSDSLRMLQYYVTGRIGVEGTQAGDTDIEGDATLRLRLWQREVSLHARARLMNSVPTYFLRHYRATLHQWDRDLSMVQRLRAGGELRIPSLGTRLYADFETTQNPLYAGANGEPMQKGGANVRVLSVGIHQDIHWRAIHWENDLLWQNSSDREVAPLPDLTVYSNLYLKLLIAKVMTLQVGVDAKWHTAYHAPYYDPTTQLFASQDEVTIGGKAPLLTAYANAHLKRIRFYLKYHNVGALLFRPAHFSMPYYPEYPPMILFGLAWDLRN